MMMKPGDTGDASRQRVLMLTTESPLPANSGLRVRILYLARALARVADVQIAALGEVPDPGHEPFEIVGVPHRRSPLRSLVGSLRKPYQSAKLASTAQARVGQSGNWDTIHAELPFLVPAALEAGVPVTMGTQQVETELARLFSRNERRAVHRARWRWETRKTATFERTMLRLADAVCATSGEEAAVFEAWGAQRVILVPNGVDTGAIAYEPPSRSKTVLYMGHFGYRPNAAAGLELVEEIFPRVRELVGDARLELVGREPSTDLRRSAGGPVEVTGEVPDVLPHLRAARVLVVPLRSGGGTRLKLLEAMAAGVPVVSTAFGAAGLDLRDGRELILAESSRDLAQHAARLLEDDELARELSRNARQLVERRYDWAIATRPFVELHQELAGRA
jgi:glycosyltransferase involved in cell wall biosynthesis